MKISLGELRCVIRHMIVEQAWVPGRYYPGAEPVSTDDASRLNQPLGEEDELDEVDTDPSNNPGRPADAYEYLGMHPEPTAAMAHPAAGGGSVSLGGGDVDGGDGGEEPADIE